MALLRSSCYNPTRLILVLTIHKVLSQPVSGIQHPHDHCCCGWQWGWSLLAGPDAAPLESWDPRVPAHSLALATGEVPDQSQAEVLPSSASSTEHQILSALPCASLHKPALGAFIVQVCQKNVPSSGEWEREKRGFVLLCWMDKCSLMKEPHPQVPAVSLQQHCLVWGVRACKPPVLVLGQTLTYQHVRDLLMLHQLCYDL